MRTDPRATSTQGVTTHGTLLPALASRSAQHAELVLPAQGACVRRARSFAAALLAWWALPADAQDTAVLIVSELTTSAAQHGRSDMTLRLTLNWDMLHIAVADHGDPGPPTPLPPDDPDEHGRGLCIVHALAARLDIHQGSAGRQVLVGLRIAHPQPAFEAAGTCARPVPQRTSRLAALTRDVRQLKPHDSGHLDLLPRRYCESLSRCADLG
ncbi:ATP-binding protein [Streptomyces sp. DSM 41527]|uniref:ATP-binding protein n=1 Tax=Streptomyces mooreae TaxID=3075523 RepID=A0ABU2TD90_9ACTN|nr:ATP-binding protein [Streptomyces sp. DSM 41527]MDT0458914.1 ATP-binding protein [Streptomyces sp. DSM 41527]